MKFRQLGNFMDTIGWRIFMEGMLSQEVLNIQSEYVGVGACSLFLDGRAKGLAITLLEATHEQ